MIDEISEKLGIDREKIESENFLEDLEDEQKFFKDLDKDFFDQNRDILRKERERLLNKKRSNKEFDSSFLRGDSNEKLWDDERKKS